MSSLVALSVTTGKQVRSPKSGQLIYWGIKGVRGGVTKINTKTPQLYTKKDFKALNAIIANAGKGKFVAYEEKTRRVLKKSGQPVASGKKDAQGRTIPQKITRLTRYKKGRAQRPVLVSKKATQLLAYDFRTRSKRELVDTKLLTLLKSSNKKPVFTKEIFFEGKTLHDTLVNIRGLVPPTEYKSVSGFWIEGVVKIYDEFSELIHAVRVSEFFFKQHLVRMPMVLSKTIRRALAYYGLRFTSLFDLEQLQQKHDNKGSDIDVMSMTIQSRQKDVAKLRAVRPERGGKTIKSAEKQMTVSVALKMTSEPKAPENFKRSLKKSLAKSKAAKPVKKAMVKSSRKKITITRSKPTTKAGTPHARKKLAKKQKSKALSKSSGRKSKPKTKRRK